MKYLSIVFVAAITLVSCGGGMETVCDCADAYAALDQGDTAAVAEFMASNEEACAAIMADTAQSDSTCAENAQALNAAMNTAMEGAGAETEDATEETSTEEAATEEVAEEAAE